MMKIFKAAMGLMLATGVCMAGVGCTRQSEAMEQKEAVSESDFSDGLESQTEDAGTEKVQDAGAAETQDAESSKPQGTESSEMKGAETSGTQDAETSDAPYTLVWGPVLKVEDGKLHMDNRSGFASRGELVLTLDAEETKILDAEDGYPVDVSELEDEDAVFAYIEPMMALSEPPITGARLVLCDLPDDLRVPEYVLVETVEKQQDGSLLLSAAGGMQYLVPADCQILPYLTKNIVTLEELQTGSTCLIWSDERQKAQKIVLFADSQEE